MDKLNIPWYLKTFLMVYIVIGCWSIVEVVLWFLEVVGGANMRKSKDIKSWLPKAIDEIKRDRELVDKVRNRLKKASQGE